MQRGGNSWPSSALRSRFFRGPRDDPSEVHEEDLSRHGEVKAVSWAPVNVGAAFACALSDGTVTATIHQGTVRSGEADVEHRWQTQSFAIHQGEVHAVSWASSVGPELGKLAGACLASAGDDGLRVWSILDVQGRCKEEEDFRDVAWKPWDGNYDTLACVRGQEVIFWVRVVYQPRVTVRKSPSLTAPSVAFLEAGEIVEIAEVRQGWVRLAESETQARDVSEDCEAWVLQDGKAVSLGILLEPCEPRWFRVVFEPRVPVRTKASVQAPAIAFLEAGAVIEADEVWEGWVRLSTQDRKNLDISDDCGSWVLIDGHAKGAGRLLVTCPPPAERRPQLEVAECRGLAHDKARTRELRAVHQVLQAGCAEECHLMSWFCLKNEALQEALPNLWSRCSSADSGARQEKKVKHPTEEEVEEALTAAAAALQVECPYRRLPQIFAPQEGLEILSSMIDRPPKYQEKYLAQEWSILAKVWALAPNLGPRSGGLAVVDIGAGNGSLALLAGLLLGGHAVLIDHTLPPEPMRVEARLPEQYRDRILRVTGDVGDLDASREIEPILEKHGIRQPTPFRPGKLPCPDDFLRQNAARVVGQADLLVDLVLEEVFSDAAEHLEALPSKEMHPEHANGEAEQVQTEAVEDVPHVPDATLTRMVQSATDKLLVLEHELRMTYGEAPAIPLAKFIKQPASGRRHPSQEEELRRSCDTDDEDWRVASVPAKKILELERYRALFAHHCMAAREAGIQSPSRTATWVIWPFLADGITMALVQSAIEELDDAMENYVGNLIVDEVGFVAAPSGVELRSRVGYPDLTSADPDVSAWLLRLGGAVKQTILDWIHWPLPNGFNSEPDNLVPTELEGARRLAAHRRVDPTYRDDEDRPQGLKKPVPPFRSSSSLWHPTARNALYYELKNPNRPDPPIEWTQIQLFWPRHAYSWEEILSYYSGTHTRREIKAYWKRCKELPAVTASSGKVEKLFKHRLEVGFGKVLNILEESYLTEAQLESILKLGSSQPDFRWWAGRAMLDFKSEEGQSLVLWPPWTALEAAVKVLVGIARRTMPDEELALIQLIVNYYPDGGSRVRSHRRPCSCGTGGYALVRDRRPRQVEGQTLTMRHGDCLPLFGEEHAVPPESTAEPRMSLCLFYASQAEYLAGASVDKNGKWHPPFGWASGSGPEPGCVRSSALIWYGPSKQLEEAGNSAEKLMDKENQEAQEYLAKVQGFQSGFEGPPEPPRPSQVVHGNGPVQLLLEPPSGTDMLEIAEHQGNFAKVSNEQLAADKILDVEKHL
eukprot:g269.t1